MAYSNFSVAQLKKQFELQENHVNLFEKINAIAPSNWLQETFENTLEIAYTSEKSRCEGIIMPILVEMRKRNNKAFAVYSGANLDAKKDEGLNGECDFILTNTPQYIDLERPIFCLLEAKDENIIKNLGQCAAQMMGARYVNEQDKNNEIVTIFGCVTTGDEWQFMKLENKQILIDTKRYYLNELPVILGVLQQIIDFYKKPAV